MTQSVFASGEREHRSAEVGLSLKVNVIALLLPLDVTLAVAFSFGAAPERLTAMLFIAAVASQARCQRSDQRFYPFGWRVALADLMLLGGLVTLLGLADRFWIVMLVVQGVSVLAPVVRYVETDIVRRDYAISISAPDHLTLGILLVRVASSLRLTRQGRDVHGSRLAGSGEHPD